MTAPAATSTAEICARYQAGASIDDISRDTGLPRYGVWHTLHAAGVQMRPRGGRPGSKGRAGGSRLTVREQEVMDLVDAGLRGREIAERLGISHGTVRQIKVAARRRMEGNPTPYARPKPANAEPPGRERNKLAQRPTSGALVDLALDLAVRIREGADPDAAALTLFGDLRAMRADDVRHLALVLAAIVDIDQPRSAVLAWCDGVPPSAGYVKQDGGNPARPGGWHNGCRSEELYRRHSRQLTPGQRCLTCKPKPAPVCPSETAYRAHLKADEACPTGVCRPYMARVEAARRRKHPEWAANGRDRGTRRVA